MAKIAEMTEKKRQEKEDRKLAELERKSNAEW